MAAVLLMGLPLWGMPSLGLANGAQLFSFIIGLGVWGIGLFLHE
ncbi:MAG: hypothetical protein R3B96_22220 [Pirellulaceae bacterium]